MAANSALVPRAKSESKPIQFFMPGSGVRFSFQDGHVSKAWYGLHHHGSYASALLATMLVAKRSVPVRIESEPVTGEPEFLLKMPVLR
jgi:hypothetical protein